MKRIFFIGLVPSCYYGFHTLFGRISVVHVAKTRARLDFIGHARLISAVTFTNAGNEIRQGSAVCDHLMKAVLYVGALQNQRWNLKSKIHPVGN